MNKPNGTTRREILDWIDRENSKLFDNWEEIRDAREENYRKRKRKRKLAHLKKRMKSRRKRKQYYKTVIRQ